MGKSSILIFVVRLLETHVVVSQAKAVGHMAVQYGHGLFCDGPFLRCVCLNDISLMNEKGNVEPLMIISYPAGLLEKVASQIPVPPLLGKLQPRVAVELGVR